MAVLLQYVVLGSYRGFYEYPKLEIFSLRVSYSLQLTQFDSIRQRIYERAS